MAVAEAAVAYARAGFYVVPIKPGTKNAGSVLGIGWPSKSSRDATTVADLWREHPSAGIAIHTGRSGIVVFDVDLDSLPSELAPLEAGLIHRSRADTDSQRGHYIFASGETYTAGALRLSDGTKAGDIRSGNTIIAVEPTPHANGGLYRCADPGEIPPLSTQARQLLRLAPQVGDSDVAKFLDAYQGNEGDYLAYCLKLAVKRFNNLVRRYEETEISDKRSKNRHDAMHDVLCLTLKEAHTQAYSAAEAVSILRKKWLKAIEGDSHHSADEFERMLPSAVDAANRDDPIKRRERMSRDFGTDTRTKPQYVQAGKAAMTTGHTMRDPRQMRKDVEAQRNLLTELHSEFRRWFGPHYDLSAIDATLAAAAVEKLSGDPLWLLLVSGASTAKSETVTRLEKCERVVPVSTLTTEAALLSATGKDDKDPNATGGILREVGESGIIVFKDVTSILSMNPSTRAPILAALREVYDGEWHRGKGTDGGSRLHWKGRVIVVGAVTTAWDKHHAVVAEMGDRFILLRIDSTDLEARLAHGAQAIENTGDEYTMRAKLSGLTAKVIENVNPKMVPKLKEAEQQRILAAANFASYARTAVETNYKGDVIDSHAPEGPARLSKQLTQLFRGSCVIGLDRRAAMELVIRSARDCIPPLRLLVLEDLAQHPCSKTNDIRKRLQKPFATIDRVIQSLVALGMVEQDETDEPYNNGSSRQVWRFSLHKSFNTNVLAQLNTNPQVRGVPGI
ncbi:bifunctional DNA primase/polymerase [Mycolicibacterium sp. BiH015]|uniref:bifunctional DNA primase/polymerase n=1 Tax=Mycolicibacterium sp. BiH015 TaxID=3018808 RepID=UPI0022E366B4|nr:bifunctional DNA primase/polymerase [Mycolicibacterium sp. BiH015]MDA2890997.1 bifunctional DNA primase/polymerase [Mycolicibacterium sp. BiH015]